MAQRNGPSAADSSGDAVLPTLTSPLPTSFAENSHRSSSIAWLLLLFPEFTREILSASVFEAPSRNFTKQKRLPAASFVACCALQNRRKARASARSCNPFAKATKLSCARWQTDRKSVV